jgi:D-xylose transport system permease protein
MMMSTIESATGWRAPFHALARLANRALPPSLLLLVARLGIPSFVVSLAYFLGLQGAMLLIIGEGGTIPIRNEQILAIMNKNMPVALGWLFAIIVIGGFAAATFWAIRTRRRAGLQTPAMSLGAHSSR